MREYKGKKSFSSLYTDLTKTSFAKHGFANQKIAAHWPMIVGQTIAQYTLPQKIVFKPNSTRGGILHVGVSNPGLSLELQAKEAFIVDKISTFFGYQAVSRIKVNIDRSAANSNKPPKAAAPKTSISKKEAEKLLKQLEAIKDPELKTNLEELYKGMFE